MSKFEVFIGIFLLFLSINFILFIPILRLFPQFVFIDNNNLLNLLLYLLEFFNLFKFDFGLDFGLDLDFEFDALLSLCFCNLRNLKLSYFLNELL